MKKKQNTGGGGAGEPTRPAGETVAAPAADRPSLSVLGMRVGALENLTLCLLAELETMQGRGEPAAGGVMDFYAEVREFEVQMIVAALRQAGGKQSEAARLLKLKPTTLNSKLKMYNLRPENPACPQVYRLQDAHRGDAGEESSDSSDT